MSAFHRLAVSFALFAAALSLAAGPPVPFPGPPVPKTYDELIAQAQAGDPATNFTALRLRYALSDSYDGYGTKFQRLYDALSALDNAQSGRDCAKIVAAADDILKVEYVSWAAHVERSDCLRQLGDLDGAGRESFIANGLLNSISASGDGKTPATAIVVVSMYEEEFVTGALNLTGAARTLLYQDDHYYHRIDGTQEATAGDKVTLWFRVDALVAGAERDRKGTN